MSPQRLVLDTNILLDIFVFRDPAARDLLAALQTPTVQVLVTTALLHEFWGVLKKESFDLSLEAQQAISKAWQHQTVLIQEQAIEPAPWKCRDQADQMFLDLAYSCRPITLISKDKQVLKLRKRAARDQVRITANLIISYD